MSSVEESSRSKEKIVSLDDDVSWIPSPLMGVSSTEDVNIQDVTNNARGTEVEVKEVGEARPKENGEINYHEETENHTSESRESFFCSQALKSQH